jgi:hypothetical protein
MKKLTARDLKDFNVIKHYRIIRKWACKNNGLNDADLELLIYFDCMDFFTKHDFEIGTYSYSWDNRRWNKVSFKCKQLISRMYRIMLGEEDIPSSERRNKIIKGISYTDKVLTQAIYNVNKDKQR